MNLRAKITEMVTGLQPLIDRYGYVPSFHDAVVMHLEYSVQTKTVEIVVRYNDNVLPDGPIDLYSDIRVKFQDVIAGGMHWTEWWMYEMSWVEEDGFVTATFWDQANGEDMSIKCKNLEFELLAEPIEDRYKRPNVVLTF